MSYWKVTLFVNNTYFSIRDIRRQLFCFRLNKHSWQSKSATCTTFFGGNFNLGSVKVEAVDAFQHNAGDRHERKLYKKLSSDFWRKFLVQTHQIERVLFRARNLKNIAASVQVNLYKFSILYVCYRHKFLQCIYFLVLLCCCFLALLDSYYITCFFIYMT